MSLANELLAKEDLLSPGISACMGCNVELTLRTVLRVLGPDTILAIPPGCMGGVGVVGWGKTTGAKVPVFFPLLDNTASMLAGIKLYYQRIGREVNVVAFAGDGASVDAGFQCLSGAAERGDNIIYICYDNEGYMNTGFQRSGSTTKGSWTTTTPIGNAGKGKRQHKKDMPLIMAMHDLPYVATATPAFMPDLVRKVEKAKTVKQGMAYLHIYNPCSTGWGFIPEKSIQISRQAVRTGLFPLYEAEYGKITLNFRDKEPDVKPYLHQMKKFSHLDEAALDDIQQHVDEKWQRLLHLESLGGRS